MIRVDHPDVIFSDEAGQRTRRGRGDPRAHMPPASPCWWERPAWRSPSSSAALRDIPHAVLNARNEEEEAAIIARAGERGAVTISTNMAGRGVGYPAWARAWRNWAGCYVIGTNRHESRRIDHQLARTRRPAGRSGTIALFHFARRRSAGALRHRDATHAARSRRASSGWWRGRTWISAASCRNTKR